MKELVEVIAKALVDDPDSVVVIRTRRQESYVLGSEGCQIPIWER